VNEIGLVHDEFVFTLACALEQAELVAVLLDLKIEDQLHMCLEGFCLGYTFW
jgi:hypothetical protein